MGLSVDVDNMELDDRDFLGLSVDVDNMEQMTETLWVSVWMWITWNR